MSDPNTSDSETLEEKHERNRRRRLAEIKEWAEYVRSNPDHVWGEQVNTLVDSQLASARHHEYDRPDMDGFREKPR